MHTEALLSTKLLRQVCVLGIALSVALLASNAEALPEPKVTITYSLETLEGGAYWQKIFETPSDLGNVEYVLDVVDSMDPSVTVFVDNPVWVVMEYTADAPGGNIVDGPVELTDTHFERQFEIDASGLTLINTTISTMLSRVGTGTLLGSTITWDNVVAPYQESVVGESTCAGFGCSFVSDPFPRDLTDTLDVILPTFTVLHVNTFGDRFASDNGTPNDPNDDIDRPDVDAMVKDTWEGVMVVPEPSGDVLLLAGALGLVGLRRLRERGDASA